MDAKMTNVVIGRLAARGSSNGTIRWSFYTDLENLLVSLINLPLVRGLKLNLYIYAKRLSSIFVTPMVRTSRAAKATPKQTTNIGPQLLIHLPSPSHHNLSPLPPPQLPDQAFQVFAGVPLLAASMHRAAASRVPHAHLGHDSASG